MEQVQLNNLLTLERLEEGIYRGQSWDLGFRALFGGQALGQAVSAAYQTVSSALTAHSLHSYFLLPGDASHPVLYDVENIRDGRSFATRRVKAIQHGKVIFYMTISFQKYEQGLEHQYPTMPDVPAPEELTSDILLYEKFADKAPKSLLEKLAYHRPMDVRSCQFYDVFNPQKTEPVRQVWFKTVESLDQEQQSHQRMLAYASDYYFLLTALQAHGLSSMNRNLRLATIDHAIWFHRPFRFDDWLLYSVESPTGGNGRAFVNGRFYNRAGELVASTTQEGVMRLKHSS